MKKLILLSLVLLLTLALVACNEGTTPECQHTGGTATCTQKAVCASCGESYGEMLGHDYADATCLTPKTCKTCGATEGEAIGHDYADATCLTPKTCKTCGATEGEAIGHDYADATCEAPKTCKICGTTEGEPIAHTYADELTGTKDGHYYACICHPEIIEYADHTGADVDGICNECGYVVTEATTFTVTVRDDYGNAVKDVPFKIYDSSFEHLVVTDSEGVASCEFVHFDTVYAEMLLTPVGYLAANYDPIAFVGTELTVELTKTVFFQVKVINESGVGVENFPINFMIPFQTINTDANGFATLEMPEREFGDQEQLFFINYIPDGYALLDAPFNTLIKISKNGSIAVTLYESIYYTLTAGDTNGDPLKNAEIKPENSETTYKTDESGTVVIPVPSGEQTFRLSHASAFYTLVGEEFITLSEDNNSYNIVYEESSEPQMLNIYLYYDDGTIPSDWNIAQVYYYIPGYYETDGLLAVTPDGFAATFSYNEDKIFLAIDKDHNYGFGYYTKGSPTTLDIIIEKGRPLGKSEEDAVYINALLDLPFPDDTLYLFKNEHPLAAGEYLYVKVVNALGRSVSIDGEKFILEYNGSEVAPSTDGRIRLTFADVEPGDEAIFKIIAKTDAIEDVEIDTIGSIDNPITIYPSVQNPKSAELTFIKAGQEIYLLLNPISGEGIFSADYDEEAVTVEGIPTDTVTSDEWVSVKVTAKKAGDVTVTFSFAPVE